MNRTRTQPTLPPAPRPHDLPPRWDGHRVEWRGWEVLPPTTLERFHGVAAICPHCASTRPQAITTGVVWVAPVGLLAFPTKQRWDARGSRSGGDHAAQWLTAYRCLDCHADEVEDRMTGELWVLDDSDYGDDGSYA